MGELVTFGKAEFKPSDIIMPDTNVLLSFAGFDDDQTVRRECEALIQNATSSGAIIAISCVAYNELVNVITRSVFKSNGFEGEKQIKNLRKKSPNTYSSIHGQAMNTFKDYKRKIFRNLAVFPEIIGELNSETINESFRLMEKYEVHGLSDAQQVAIAMKENIPYLASMDEDFLPINEPGLTILFDENTSSKAIFK